MNADETALLAARLMHDIVHAGSDRDQWLAVLKGHAAEWGNLDAVAMGMLVCAVLVDVKALSEQAPLVVKPLVDQRYVDTLSRLRRPLQPPSDGVR